MELIVSSRASSVANPESLRGELLPKAAETKERAKEIAQGRKTLEPIIGVVAFELAASEISEFEKIPDVLVTDMRQSTTGE